MVELTLTITGTAELVAGRADPIAPLTTTEIAEKRGDRRHPDVVAELSQRNDLLGEPPFGAPATLDHLSAYALNTGPSGSALLATLRAQPSTGLPPRHGPTHSIAELSVLPLVMGWSYE